ncbi:uncharacterized protein LOC131939769 [Physella acuta]|uniref:uncharacterized protein LOC131939769 n=1 Tax=Physella acuta TaxID=109671 RepID=UPI0027DDAC33|nr:uncharacterized protein LOC131939769 [Physella acuta]
MSTKEMARTHPVVSRPASRTNNLITQVSRPASRTNNLITLVTQHRTADPTSYPSTYPSSEHDTYLLDDRRVTDTEPHLTSVFVDRCSPPQWLQTFTCDVTQPGGETQRAVHEPDLLTTDQADWHQGKDTKLTCARSCQQISYLPPADVPDTDLQQPIGPWLARKNRRKCFSAAQTDHVTGREPPPDLEFLVPRVKGRAPKTCMAPTQTNTPSGAPERGMSGSLVMCRPAVLYIRQKPARPSVVVPHPLFARTPRRPSHHLVSLSYTTKPKHPNTITTAAINPTTQTKIAKNNCLKQISVNTHVPRPRIVIPPPARKVRRRSRRLRPKLKDEGCETTDKKIDSEICLSEKRNSSRSSHKYISPWGTLSESGSGSLTSSECSNTSLYRHKRKRKRRNKHRPVKSAKTKQTSPSSSGKLTKKVHDFWDAIMSSALKSRRRGKRSGRTRLSPQARTAGYVSATRRSETPKQRLRNIACCRALAAPPYLGAAPPLMGAAPPLMGAASDVPQNKASEHQLDSHNTNVLIEAIKVIDLHCRSRPTVRLHVKTSEKQSQKVRSLEKPDQQDKSLEKQDQQGKSLEKRDQQGKSLEKQDQQGKSLEKQDQQGKSLEKQDQQGKSLEKQDQQGKSLEKQDQRGKSLEKQDQQGKSLEKQDQQGKSLEVLNKRARKCVKAPTKKCSSLPNLPVNMSSRWNQDTEPHDPQNKHTEPHNPQNKHTEPHNPQNKHTEPHNPQNKHTEPHNPQNKHTEPHNPQNKHTEPHNPQNKHTEPHDTQNKHTYPRSHQELTQLHKNSTMSPSEIDIRSYRSTSNTRRLEADPSWNPGVGDTRVTPRVRAATARLTSGRATKQSGLAAGSRAGGEGTAPHSPTKPVKDGASRMLEVAGKQGNVRVKRKTKIAKNK